MDKADEQIGVQVAVLHLKAFILFIEHAET